MDDLSQDIEAVDDVLFDKFNYVMGFDLFGRDSPRPLGEIISYCQDKPMCFR